MFSGHSLGDGRGETVTVCTQRGGRWLAFCPRPHVLRRAASFPGQPRVQTHTNRLCLQTLFQQPVSIHGFDTFTPVYSNNLYEQQSQGSPLGVGWGSPSGFPEFISGVRGVAVTLETVKRRACRKVTPSEPGAPRAVPTQAPNSQATPAASSSSFWKSALSRGSAMG